MKQLSKIELYNWILNLYDQDREDELSTYFYNILGQQRELFYDVLHFNVRLLTGIEEYFLADREENMEVTVDSIVSVYQANRLSVEQLGIMNYISEDLGEFELELSQSSNAYVAFNKLLKMLDGINNKILKELFKHAIRYKEKRDTNRTKVFLSYAYEDRLYTLCLHMYMKVHDILLYVDWLFCPGLDSGKEIKENLSAELESSQQFLFLRTVNSELHIRGNKNVRGWCSWEMGYFYNEKSAQEKFILELYSRKERKKGKANKDSLQLDGIPNLKRVFNGKLE